MSIEGAPETARAAREPNHDAAGNKVFCARFSASEALEHKERVVVPEAGWVAVFW